MENLKSGKPAIDLIRLCYEANRPILLVGKHGIGKSELLEQAANQMGIEYITRDLSLMEPPDLIGLPKPHGKSTIYLPPAFLPTDGKGLIVFEELNRAEKFMQAPCLQLLTSRTLNDYCLPSAWLPVAAINPSDDDYEVSDIDPALLSRFVQVRLVPDRTLWLEWAGLNEVYDAVIDYVRSEPSVFDNPISNPRAWKYVSDILHAAPILQAANSTIRAAVTGLVGKTRGTAFLRFLKSIHQPATAEQILSSYSSVRKSIQDNINAGRIDFVNASLHAVMLYLQPECDYQRTRSDRKQWRNLGDFLSDLPGDLHEQATKFFTERKRECPIIKKTRKSKNARSKTK